VEDAVNPARNRQRLANVVAQKFKIGLAEQMVYILGVTSNEVINASNTMARGN
jgi:hypothetical protein